MSEKIVKDRSRVVSRFLDDSRMDPITGDIGFTHRIDAYLADHRGVPSARPATGGELIGFHLREEEIEKTSLLSAIRERRSSRAFSESSIAYESLSTLLDLSYGASADGKRVVPSAGLFYPLDVHVFALNVEGLPAGVYRHDVLARGVRKTGELGSPELLDHDFPGLHSFPGASVILAVTSDVSRMEEKYGARTGRFILAEFGAWMQNVQLLCASLGLASCPYGTGYDLLIEKRAGVSSSTEFFLGAVVVGRPI